MWNNHGTITLNGGTRVGEYGGLKFPLFRVFCDESSLDPLDFPILVTSLSISHLQLSSTYYSYDPFPTSHFHLLLGHPYRHTFNKGSLSPPYSLALVPPFSVSFP